MYDQSIVQITRADNGYSLRVLVPEEPSEDGENAPMMCPEYKTVVFKTVDEVTNFLSTLLPAYPMEAPEPEEADFDAMFIKALRG